MTLVYEVSSRIARNVSQRNPVSIEKDRKEMDFMMAVMLWLHVLKDSVGDWNVQCTVLLVLARKHEWFRCFQREEGSLVKLCVFMVAVWSLAVPPSSYNSR